jgi:signal transduction histidine kinase
MHGGWLWAESEGIEGEGSVFYLDLPIGNPESLTIQ